jgi:hypothetical protein
MHVTITFPMQILLKLGLHVRLEIRHARASIINAVTCVHCRSVLGGIDRYRSRIHPELPCVHTEDVRLLAYSSLDVD